MSIVHRSGGVLLHQPPYHWYTILTRQANIQFAPAQPAKPKRTRAAHCSRWHGPDLSATTGVAPAWCASFPASARQAAADTTMAGAGMRARAHLRPPTCARPPAPACTSATASRGLPATTHPLPRPYHRSWVSRQHLKGPNARGAQQIWPPGRHHQLQLAQAQPVVLSSRTVFLCCLLAELALPMKCFRLAETQNQRAHCPL